jgi:hypothetical protein
MPQLQIPDLGLTPPEEGGKSYACRDCGKEHPRVTSLLSACVPKFALVPWAEGVGRKAMYEVMRGNSGMSFDAAVNRIKEQGTTSDTERDAGADRGTATHEFLGRYIDTGEIESIQGHPDEVRPFLQSLSKFLMDYEPEFLCREVHVAHHDLDYAGTFDGVCIIHRQPPRRNKPIDLTGKRCLFDLKTNKDGRVYAPEMLYQVASYELAWEANGGEPNDEQIIVACGKDSYQCAVSYIEPASFADLVAFYHSQQAQMARNPNARKKK